MMITKNNNSNNGKVSVLYRNPWYLHHFIHLFNTLMIFQTNGQLHIRVEYVSMSEISESYEVDSYFSMHKGCHVTLYQDTKVPLDLPQFNLVKGPHGVTPEPRSCWTDLYHSIDQVHIQVAPKKLHLGRSQSPK